MNLEKMMKLAAKSTDEVMITFNEKNSKKIRQEESKILAENLDEKLYIIRIINNGKIGSSVFYKPEEFEKALKRAIQLSKYSEKLDICFPSQKKFKEPNIFDKKVAEINGVELKNLFQKMIKNTKKNAKQLEGSLEIGQEKKRIVDTNGLNVSESLTSIGGFAVAKSGRGIGTFWDSSHHLFDVGTIGFEAGKRAKAMKGAKKIESGKYNIILKDTGLQGILELLESIFSGWSIVAGSSILRDKLGKKVFSDKLNIIDNPLEKGAEGEKVDYDGFPREKKYLIENGVVKNFLFDLETLAKARKLNIPRIKSQKAGNRPMTFTNIVIPPGKDEIDDGIVINSMLGLHSFNPSRGNFSVVIDEGFYFHKGKIKPVKGNILTGDIIEMFKNPIIGKKQKRWSNLICPEICFPDVSIL